MNRVVRAARLYLVGGQSITLPWLIMASSLLINLVIFGLITAKGGADENPSTGGLLSLYAVVMLVFSQAMNKQLSFALGFSLTRRTYLLGSGLFALALSLGSAVLLYVLYGLEQATGGWWMNLSFFGIYGLGEGNPVLAVLGYAAPMMALIALGTLLGGINARWGPTGLYLAGVAGLIGGGALAVIMTYAEAWTAFGNWFDDQPTAALLAGYPWILAALLAGGTYLIVRRVAA